MQVVLLLWGISNPGYVVYTRVCSCNIQSAREAVGESHLYFLTYWTITGVLEAILDRGGTRIIVATVCIS